MKELSVHDQEILRLLSSGTSDEAIQKALEITSEAFQAALDRILARAAVETGDAGRLYEQALRVRAEKRIQGLQARFAALMDLLEHGILVVDGYSGEVKACNGAACMLFGYSQAELIGLSVEALVAKEFREAHPALRKGFLLSARKRALGYHPPIFGVRKDGAEVEMAIALTATGADDDVMVICTEHRRWVPAETTVGGVEKRNGPR